MVKTRLKGQTSVSKILYSNNSTAAERWWRFPIHLYHPPIVAIALPTCMWMGLQSSFLHRGPLVVLQYTILRRYPSNTTIAIIQLSTITCPYHGHIPSTTGVWCIKSFTNNPSTIWCINFTSAVGVREDIYITAIAMLMLWFSISTVECSYHGHIPSTTGVWSVKSSTNNPITIWYGYYISAGSVWRDIYNKAIAKWGWRWVVATLLWPLLTAYTYLIHPTIPTCPLHVLVKLPYWSLAVCWRYNTNYII